MFVKKKKEEKREKKKKQSGSAPAGHVPAGRRTGAHADLAVFAGGPSNGLATITGGGLVGGPRGGCGGSRALGQGPRGHRSRRK